MSKRKPKAVGTTSYVFRAPDAGTIQILHDHMQPAIVRLMVGGERIELAEGEHTIGRGEDASVTLEEHSVSRRHAALTWRNGRAVLRDLGSSNGTFIGDREIEAEERLDLPVTVSFGAVEVILEKGRIAHG